jgi:hypothetical protein
MNVGVAVVVADDVAVPASGSAFVLPHAATPEAVAAVAKSSAARVSGLPSSRATGRGATPQCFVGGGTP